MSRTDAPVLTSHHPIAGSADQAGTLLAPPALVSRDGREVGIVHLTAELSPYARTGGLGEAVAGLAGAQARGGVPTSIIMPMHRIARERAGNIERIGDPFVVKFGERTETAELYATPRREGVPRVYFIDHAEYFDRPALYGEDGVDYIDNARRFGFFTRAALEALPRIADGPLIVHSHDWHTALAPVYLRALQVDRLQKRSIWSVLTVHNAGFQGEFEATTMEDLGIPPELFNWRQLERFGKMNILKGGLSLADGVLTVSPTHAHELRTNQGGFGLDGVFLSLRDRFVGVLNGIDVETWNPSTDPVLAAHYSRTDLRGKRRCRIELQTTFGLRRRSDVPIFALTARLVSQKGLDLILGDPGYFALDAQYVFLGAGEPRYEAALTEIAERAPTRISVETNFSDKLEHVLLAGADMCLMPSLYEPCGLTQMRAQRYGTIPVARRVGGLADTIEDGVTGFLFDEYTSDDFMRAASRALDHYEDRDGWQAMMRAAMSCDFSWERADARCRQLYRRVVTGATQAV